MDTIDFDTDFSLKGKVALITGAGKGIGRAVAMMYAAKGSDLVIVGKSENIFEAAESVSCKSGRSSKAGSLEIKCLPLLYDISDPNNISPIVSRSLKEFKRIDILVNNAGIVFAEEALKVSKTDWDKTIAINLTAPFLLSQEVGKNMIKRKYGKIINISSLASVIGFEKRSSYCASKAGLVGLTKALALEWAKYNITVNAISPTVTMTEMAKKAWAGEAGENMKKKIPLGRFIEPQEVAAVAAFLGSDASNMITGTNIILDGGYSIN